MSVHDEEPPYAAVVCRCPDLVDHVDQNLRCQRHRPWPTAAMPKGATIRQARKYKDACAFTNRLAKLISQHGIHAASKVRSVLLGRARGEDCSEITSLEIVWNFRPGTIGPEHRAYSTQPPALTRFFGFGTPPTISKAKLVPT